MTSTAETIKSTVRNSKGTSLREERRAQAQKLQAEIEAKKAKAAVDAAPPTLEFLVSAGMDAFKQGKTLTEVMTVFDAAVDALEQTGYPTTAAQYREARGQVKKQIAATPTPEVSEVAPAPKAERPFTPVPKPTAKKTPAKAVAAAAEPSAVSKAVANSKVAKAKTIADQKADFAAEQMRQVLSDIHALDPKFNGEGLTISDLRKALRSAKAVANKTSKPAAVPTATALTAAQKARRERIIARLLKLTPTMDPHALDGKTIPQLREMVKAARAAKRAARAERKGTAAAKVAKSDLPLCIECGSTTGRHAHHERTVFCTWKCGNAWALKHLTPDAKKLLASAAKAGAGATSKTADVVDRTHLVGDPASETLKVVTDPAPAKPARKPRAKKVVEEIIEAVNDNLAEAGEPTEPASN